MASLVGAFLLPHVPLIGANPEAPPPEKRKIVHDAFAKGTQRLRELAVDTVVIVGDDHYVLFGPQCLPRCLIGIGDVDGPVENWINIERRAISNDTSLAEHIMSFGMENGVDWSVSKTLTLDHSVMIPYHYAVSPCQDIKVVPIYLACAVEPFISSARARSIGKVTGDAIRSFPDARRVAVIGTGGLSHWVGMPQMGQVNEDWDRRALAHVIGNDLDALVALKDEDVIAEAGNGALEIKNWICAMAAAGDVRAELIAYEPVPQWVSGCGFVELKVA